MDQKQSQFAEKIRADLVFEQLVVSVLTGAFVGAGLVFAFTLIGGVILGGLSFYFLLMLVLKTMVAAFLIFIIGLFAAVVVITPLYRRLEKAKRRDRWPYAAAMLAVGALGIAAMGVLPPVGGPDLGAAVAVMGASLVIAIEFSRRMRPIWRAAEREEREEAASNIIRLQ